jgi:hypothetical protein
VLKKGRRRICSIMLLLILLVSGSCEEREENYCALLDVNSASGEIYIKDHCEVRGSFVATNVTVGLYSRIESFDFVLTCRDEDRKYTGSVSNVEYSDTGRILSYNATINNTQCRWNSGTNE